MKKQIATVASACMLLAGMLQAEVVVSAGRVPTAAEDVSSSVTSISASDLERLQVTALPEALQMVPGVHVIRNGGLGQRESVFVRGASSDDVLVLVDGIEINDPSGGGRPAHLSMLDVADIERVEVLRGAQSAIYGSDALGGVINIITKRGEGPAKVTLSAEAGSFESYRGAASVQGSTGMVSYAFTATHVESDGISAANERDGNTEEDGYERTGLSGRIGITPLENLAFDLVARYSESRADYDAGAGEGGDSENNEADTERMFLGGSAKLSLLDSQWQQRLSASVATHARDYTSDWGASWFDSELVKVGWQHDFYHEDVNVLSAGVEVEDESAETDGFGEEDSEIKSLYLQDQLRLGDAVLIGGLRLDDHDTFGDEVTSRIGLSYALKDVGARLKTTYGTGFKAPSLYQLYAPAGMFGPVGNEDLSPETSTAWDAGIEQSLSDGRAKIGITYFSSDYEDLIDFDGGYVNKDEAEMQGVEVTAQVKVCDHVDVAATYTYTDAKDGEGNALIRRPRNRASADIRCQWTEDVSVNLTCIYVGSREDSFYSSTMFSSVDEELPGHVVVNLAASWDVSDTVTLFGRIENLLDKDYEQIAGYGTPGLSGYGGIRVTL
ncbi:MAG: TonB-dependent receptor [Kiritimatiellae bacterium]|nr:TonB-dependent receptor [Kiritimatiellia bacterium]